MANSTATNNGPFPAVAQMPVRFGTLTFGGAGVQVSRVLFADGLPGLNVWLLQTLGAGAVSVQVQFADGNTLLGVDFQPLVPAYPIALGVPSLNNFHLGSRQYRLQITSTGVATVRYRIVAALT